MQQLSRLKFHMAVLFLMLLANISVSIWAHRLVTKGRAEIDATFAKRMASMQAEREELNSMGEAVRKMANDAKALNDDSMRRYDAVEAIQKRLRAGFASGNLFCRSGAGL